VLRSDSMVTATGPAAYRHRAASGVQQSPALAAVRPSQQSYQYTGKSAGRLECAHWSDDDNLARDARPDSDRAVAGGNFRPVTAAVEKIYFKELKK